MLYWFGEINFLLLLLQWSSHEYFNDNENVNLMQKQVFNIMCYENLRFT